MEYHANRVSKFWHMFADPNIARPCIFILFFVMFNMPCIVRWYITLIISITMLCGIDNIM